jgi:hypothetical protein
MDMEDAISETISELEAIPEGSNLNPLMRVGNFGEEVMQPLTEASLVPPPNVLGRLAPDMLAYSFMQAVGVGILIGKNLARDEVPELQPLTEAAVADFAMDLALLPTAAHYND